MFIEFTIKRTKDPAEGDGPQRDLLIESYDPTVEGSERASVRLTNLNQEATFMVSDRAHVVVTPVDPQPI